MRIVHINDQVFPLTAADAEQVAANLAALGAAGASVELWVPRPLGGRDLTVERMADFYHIEPSFTVRNVPGLFPTHRAVEKLAHPVAVLCQGLGNAEVVYTRNIPTVLAVLRFSDRPVVWETYRTWPVQHPELAPLLTWMVRHPRFLGAITHSAVAGDSYLDLGMQPDRLLVCHNGFDPARIKPRLSRAQARARLGLDPSDFLVTYTGRMDLDKGLGLVLDMARALPAARFLLVGSRDARGPVEKVAAGIANVTMVPWQDFKDTIVYLYAADVLLIPPSAGPLKQAGTTVLPIKTFQYMACGRAILGPAGADVREVLENGRNALLTTPDDLDEAVKALSILMTDRSLARRLGDAARRDARHRTWDSRAGTILRFLESRLAHMGRT